MNIKGSKPLSTEKWQEYEDTITKISNLTFCVEARVDFIIGHISEFCKAKKPIWWLDGIIKDEVCYSVGYRSKELELNNWDYNDSFPKKFLFLSTQEITNIIRKEIEETKMVDSEEETKLDQLDKIKKAALNKLTKEEKKALGL